MLKFTAETKDRKPLVGLGLQQGNVERLRSGQPIMVSLQELDAQLPDVAVVIFYDDGTSIEQMRKAGFINADTQVREER